MGRKQTDEIRRKISIAAKKRWADPNFNKYMRESLKGWHHSEESKRKMSESHKNISVETRQKMSDSHKGKTLSKETKEKLRRAMIGRTFSSESIERMKRAQSGKIISNKEKQRLRELNVGRTHTKEAIANMTRARREMWKNPSDKFIKRYVEAHTLSPNKKENLLRQILDEHFPNEWKFVGDGQVWFDGRNPDFININGQKKIIELFGTYWHRDRDNIKITQTEEWRTNHFAKFGFDTLVIWEDELDNVDVVVGRISKFEKSGE